ncbi:MAG: MBL fold metallo-hydrolase, partial [Planctomycetes bacterium]|nr:MBL fold metallo-hydrolase [Planctomycetota bacterium]
APWLAFRLPPPAIGLMAAYYLAWIVWLRARAGGYTTSRGQRARTVVRRSAVVCLAASGLWILVSPGSLVAGRGDGRLLVTFLDVGQADAILVQFPDARSLLLDTGGFVGGSSFDVGSRIVAPALWALGVRRLDYLAISHADPDHAGGALAVVRDFAPREIWEGIPVPPDPLRQALRLAADRARIPWRTLKSGDVMSIGGVDLRIWHPPPPDWERQKVRNDDSLVCELRLGQVSVLLPGDIGRDIERGLVSRVPPAGLRVLKVAHHGSVSSSARGFVVAMQPDVAVLTIGRGTRISGEVLDTYHDAGAQLFRTDQDGAVSVETDGSRVVVRGFTGRTLSLPLPRS